MMHIRTKLALPQFFSCEVERLAFLVFQQNPAFDAQSNRNPVQIIDGYILFRTLDCAKVGSIQTSLFRETLLRPTALSPKLAHVPGDSVSEGAFRRSFHTQVY